jgi:type IV pilus assembly protein PilA
MPRSITDSLSDLVATFDFRRALSLISIILILGAATWTIDYYTNYSRISRLERTIGLLERIDALDRRGPLAPDMTEVRGKLVAEVAILSTREAKPFQFSVSDGFTNWFPLAWRKFISGALPWFLISLTTIPGLIKPGSKNSWAGFLGLQFLTVFFGFAVTVIPPTGYWIIDYILIPWGLLFVIGVIPMSIAAVQGFKKVRETALQRAILNNLRQISAAADQYFLENGVNEVAVRDLVGPDKFIKSLTSVDGEKYDALIVKQGLPVEIVRSSGEVIRY